jgi:hypothetical protein
MPKASVLPLFLFSTAVFAEPTGSLCLKSGAFNAFAKGGATVAQESARSADTQAEAERYVQVDRLPAVRVSSKTPGQVVGIPLPGRHSVRIAKDGRMRQPVAAFSFRFEEKHTNQLCLSYETFYGSWILKPLEGSTCGCSEHGRQKPGAKQ